MRKLGLFIVMCLAVMVPASAGIRVAGKWALVIGNADYEDEDASDLSYTIADAQFMYEVLSAAGYEMGYSGQAVRCGARGMPPHGRQGISNTSNVNSVAFSSDGRHLTLGLEFG